MNRFCKLMVSNGAEAWACGYVTEKMLAMLRLGHMKGACPQSLEKTAQANGSKSFCIEFPTHDEHRMWDPYEGTLHEIQVYARCIVLRSTCLLLLGPTYLFFFFSFLFSSASSSSSPSPSSSSASSSSSSIFASLFCL